VLACPYGYEEEMIGSGTWATIRYALKIHKPLAIIWPNGDQELCFGPGHKVPTTWI